MPHAIWRGSISFGLVTIPVSLFPAESPREIAFHLLDERDLSRLQNRRVNASTGEEVPAEHVVKGHETPDGRWVVVTDDDLRAANVEATQTIDILSAVCASEIEPALLSTPYYLAPEKPGRTAYALLRDTLAEAGRVALGKVVIRTRQHLVALIPEGELLLLEVVRYPYELRARDGLDLPPLTAETPETSAERNLARQLVDTISRPFDPDAPEYRDTYHDDVLAMLARKAEGESLPAPPPAPEPSGEVIDIVTLLKSSIAEAKRARG